MESHGEADKIQCSPSTKDLLAKIGGFVLLPRGPIEIKVSEILKIANFVMKIFVSYGTRISIGKGHDGNVLATGKRR